MTIKEYVENPMGKGSAAMGLNRSVIKNILTEKYRSLVSRKKIKVYQYSLPRNTYVIHLVIPSETERDNTYDVVFEFSNKQNNFKEDPSLINYDVRVFSNSPSFAYTFAYVYRQNGLLIDSLHKKLGKKFVKVAPETRNRYQVVNYEKYIFFGAMHILQTGILKKSSFRTILPGVNYSSKVRTLEEIMKDYDVAVAKIKRAKKKEAHKEEVNRKKELKTVGQGIHTITPRKKDIRSASSNIKQKKPIRKIGK